jgi:MazG family protein
MSRKFEDLVALQARLRAPGGCPWDREQTHESLRTFLLEEAYEVIETIDSGDFRKLPEELGDLLLQVVFHAQMASEAGRFEIGDVIESIHTKLVRRHPHVFGASTPAGANATDASTATEVLKNWEELKAEERRANGEAPPADASVLDGVPRTLPALLEAYQLTRRAANVGFDWERIEDLLAKLEEETAELRETLRRRAAAPDDGEAQRAVEEEVGDLLFVAVNIARFLGADPEIALKKANRKFSARFRWMEQQLAREGRRLAGTSIEEMEALWQRSKSEV